MLVVLTTPVVFGPRSSSALGKHTTLAYPVNDTNAFVFWRRASIRWSNSSWMLPVARQALNLGSSCLSLLGNYKPGPPFAHLQIFCGVLWHLSVCRLCGKSFSLLTLTWETVLGTSLTKQCRGLTHHTDGEQTGFLSLLLHGSVFAVLLPAAPLMAFFLLI